MRGVPLVDLHAFLYRLYSEFRFTRTCLVISLCLNIIYREMGRNLPVCEDVVQVVFTLRSDGWSHSQIGVHFGKIFGV